MTRVRIGIASWNTADLLDRCLRALPGAVSGLDADIVVVDNASSDDSAEMVRRHPDVTLITNDANVGYARAMNQALMHHTAGELPEVLIALNPDTVPPPGSLRALVECLLADPAVGLVAPRLVNEDGSLQHSVYAFPSPLLTFIVCTVPWRLQRGPLARHWWLEGRAPHDRAGDIDWAIGAVHVMRASALATPPYCERWFMYAEDMDLCWRLHLAGWRRRLEPAVEITHVANASGRQAWGEGRTQRWWEASYDWYRLRRGVPAVHRWATMNTLGAGKMLGQARLRRRVQGARAPAETTNRIAELSAVMPTHRAMRRAPALAYLPESETEALQDD